MRKSIVLTSGGQDSCVTLAIAHKDTDVVAALFFNYGQRHIVEKVAAAKFASMRGVPFKTIPISLFATIAGSALVSNGDISGKHLQLSHLPASFLPGRNLVFMTMAAAIAVKYGANEVWTGVCETDHMDFPDCRLDTMKAIEKAIQLGIDFPDFVIVNPLLKSSKAETFELAKQLGVLEDVIEVSHTCYEGDHETRHQWGYGCAKCPACKIRSKGYSEFIKREAAP